MCVCVRERERERKREKEKERERERERDAKLGCRSTGQMLKLASGACFIPHFISLARAMPNSVQPSRAQSWD